MARKATGNPNGRPRKKITRDAFQKLCKLQCTAEEIAGFLDCSVDTLERWVKEEYDGETFAVVYKKYAAGGRASLRRRQWALAEHNATMAIWLGKQHLGQRETINVAADAEQLDKLDAILQGVKAAAGANLSPEISDEGDGGGV